MRLLFTITACLIFPIILWGQAISPQDQKVVDSISAWMRQQSADGKMPSQETIDSVTQEIQEHFQQQSKEEEPSSETTSPSDTIGATPDRELTKSGIKGSVFEVPEGKVWKVRQITISKMGERKILVTSVKDQYSDPFYPGEKIQTPSWAAEEELINDTGGDQDLTYYFTIAEFPVEKFRE